MTDRSIEQAENTRYVCGDCGNDEEFVAVQTVEETIVVDCTGAYVRDLDADTKDRHDTYCRKCESRNIADIG